MHNGDVKAFEKSMTGMILRRTTTKNAHFLIFIFFKKKW